MGKKARRKGQVRHGLPVEAREVEVIVGFEPHADSTEETAREASAMVGQIRDPDTHEVLADLRDPAIQAFVKQFGSIPMTPEARAMAEALLPPIFAGSRYTVIDGGNRDEAMG
jgi:hypothetical protein